MASKASSKIIHGPLDKHTLTYETLDDDLRISTTA